MNAAQELFGYRAIHVTPYTPEANGLAEAGVKKLKLLLDRHTREYRNWVSILPSCQFSVNQWLSKGIAEKPFTALFGYSPPSLAGLEDPSLLPMSSAPQANIRDLGLRMSKLHSRIRAVSDEIKSARNRAARANEREAPPVYILRPGDYVWLRYQDAAKQRYIRKYGHGKPWKHRYKVLEVRPHKVLLDVPTDGSVPEVLPWQSLRKCSLAADHLHDEDLPVPDVDDETGLVLMPEDEVEEGALRRPKEVIDVYKGWTRSRLYEISRIISAELRDDEWFLYVLWKHYDEPTPELESVIRETVKDEEILAQIQRCKCDHLLLNPSQRRRINTNSEITENGVDGVFARSLILDIAHVMIDDYSPWVTAAIDDGLQAISASSIEVCLAADQFELDYCLRFPDYKLEGVM